MQKYCTNIVETITKTQKVLLYEVRDLGRFSPITHTMYYFHTNRPTEK